MVLRTGDSVLSKCSVNLVFADINLLNQGVQVFVDLIKLLVQLFLLFSAFFENFMQFS